MACFEADKFDDICTHFISELTMAMCSLMDLVNLVEPSESKIISEILTPKALQYFKWDVTACSLIFVIQPFYLNLVRHSLK